MLKSVASAAEFESALKAGLESSANVAALSDVPPAFKGSAPSGHENAAYTTTYVQEADVDEPDAVKYDGAHLFVAPTRTPYGCCAVRRAEASASAAADPVPARHAIRVLSTDPDAGTANEVAAIELDPEETVQGLYVRSGRLVAVTTAVFHPAYGDRWWNVVSWGNSATTLTIYDVSHPERPAAEAVLELDGGFVASRRIGDTVYVVSRYTPTLPGFERYAADDGAAARNKEILDAASLNELLPSVRIDGGAPRALFEPTDCYVSRDDATRGYPVLTMITAVPLDRPDALSTTCYDENAYGVYASARAVYLTQHRVAQQPDGSFAEHTRIHEFLLDGTAVTYRGSAEIDGMLWSGGQQDFRLSEHQGRLRALTTSWTGDGADAVDHHLFVLEESPKSRSLDVVARLPNAEQPEEIGKPGENLYGVRFFDERAFAVTFQQIDPLYVIDLSDPHHPILAGSLDLPGFSDFLHPVSAGLLLGLGQTPTRGLKLELFDVSDYAHPLSVSAVTIGGSGSSSEAQYNRHAFTYLPGTVDRFAVPAYRYALDDSRQWEDTGLFLYEIRDKDVPAIAAIYPIGSLLVEQAGADAQWPGVQRSRSVIHGNTAYYIADDEVWSTSWLDPTRIGGPF